MARIRDYFVIYFCGLVGPLSGNAILAMWNELRTTFGVTLDEVMLSIPAFMVPFAVFQLFTGTLSDQWGRKRTLILGMALYAASSAGIVLLDDFVGFLALRATQGVGISFAIPVTMAMLGDITERNKYGLAMGFFGSFTTAGLAAGPLIGGFFAEIDWHLAFAVFSALALSSIIMITVILRYQESPSEPKSGKIIVSNMRDALRNRNLVIAAFIGAITFFAIIGNMSFLADYLRLEDGFAYTASEVGLILSLSAAVGIFISPLAGSITDRCAPRFSVGFGLVVSAAGIALLAFANEFYQFVVLIAFSGVGISFIWTGLLTVTVGEIPALRGTSSSIFNSARFSGYAISPVLLGPAYAAMEYIGVAAICTALLLISISLIRPFPHRPCRNSGI